MKREKYKDYPNLRLRVGSRVILHETIGSRIPFHLAWDLFAIRNAFWAVSAPLSLQENVLT
jgi:hypothetical protein